MPLLTLVYKLWKTTTTIEESNHATVEKNYKVVDKWCTIKMKMNTQLKQTRILLSEVISNEYLLNMIVSIITPNEQEMNMSEKLMVLV
jgi:hypothetical protein